MRDYPWTRMVAVAMAGSQDSEKYLQVHTSGIGSGMTVRVMDVSRQLPVPGLSNFPIPHSGEERRRSRPGEAERAPI